MFKLFIYLISLHFVLLRRTKLSVMESSLTQEITNMLFQFHLEVTGSFVSFSRESSFISALHKINVYVRKGSSVKSFHIANKKEHASGTPLSTLYVTLSVKLVSAT